MADDSYLHGSDAACYECGHELSPDEQDRDQCRKCGRHFHDDLEDYDGEPEEDDRLDDLIDDLD